MLHRLISLAHVETIDAFHNSVGNHRNCVIPDHRVSLVRGQLPDGQTASLFVLDQERLDKVASAFLIDDGVKRVRRPERIPEREDSVVCKLPGFVCFEIATTITAIDVHEEIGRRHRVIEGGVEVG